MATTLYREATLTQGGTGKAVWATLPPEDAVWLLSLVTAGTARATIVFSQGDGVSRHPLIVDVPVGGTTVCFIGRLVEVGWLDTSGAPQVVSVLPTRLSAWVQTKNYVVERVQTTSFVGVDAPALPPLARTVRLEAPLTIGAVLVLFDSTGTPVAEISANTDPVPVAGLSKVTVVTTTPGYTRVVYELVV